MAIKFLDLHKQYLSLQDEIHQAIQRVMAKSVFVGGEEVALFEEAFGRFIGEDVLALGVGNGTDALEIALQALELPKDSEVLVPANTFAASAEAVVRNGLKIVFVDCGDDYTLDLADLESKITPLTKAVVAVHLYGQAVKMDSLLEIAKRHGLRVIEDCAQAHGAAFDGKKVGTFGEIATFSFYPGKNLGAYGDGGMIVSKDLSLIEKCQRIAHHGGLRKYEHKIVGRNSRLDSLQAAILRVKLPYLEAWNKRRQEVASLYQAHLENTALVLPQVKEKCDCVWHLFVVRCEKRDSLVKHLSDQNIEVGLHYPISLPHCPAYQNQNYVRETLTPNACKWESQILSLPMGEHLSDEEVCGVVEALRRAYE